MAVEWMVFAGIGLGALLVGGAIGYLLGGRTGGAKRVGELEEALEAKEEEMSSYRSEVYAQFSETADRFKQLDESYHALHRQLATSAVALCGDQATPLLTQDLASERLDSPEPEKVVDEVTSEGAIGEGGEQGDSERGDRDEDETIVIAEDVVDEANAAAATEARESGSESESPGTQDIEQPQTGEASQSDAEAVPTLTETAESERLEEHRAGG